MALEIPLWLPTGATELASAIEQRAIGEVRCDACSAVSTIDAPFGVIDEAVGEAALLVPESSRWRELDELRAFHKRLGRAGIAYPSSLLRPQLCFGWDELLQFLGLPIGAAAPTVAAPAAAPVPSPSPSHPTHAPLPSAAPAPAPHPLPVPSPSLPALQPQSMPPRSSDSTLSASRAVFASLSERSAPPPATTEPAMTSVAVAAVVEAAASDARDDHGNDEEEREPATSIHRSLPTAPPNAEARFAQAAARCALYLDGREAVACAIAPKPNHESLEARVELVNLPTYSLVLVTLGYAPLKPGTIGLFRVPLDPEDGRTEPAIRALDEFASLRVSFFDEHRKVVHTATATLRPGQRLLELVRRAHEENGKLPHGGKSFERAAEVLTRAVDQKAAAPVAAAPVAAAPAAAASPRTTQTLGAVPGKAATFRRLTRQELPDASNEHLVKMLDDAELRVDAALLLCERRDATTLAGLCQALARMPRLEASRVLPAMTGFGANSESYLIDFLAAKKAYLRQGAALALGQLRTARGTEALCQALIEEPTEIWGEVARALGDAGAQAVMPLGAKLRDVAVSSEERDRIVRALAHIAAGGVRGPVEMLGTSRDAVVADAAKRALALVAEVQRLDKEVRTGTTEHTVVRGFSHRFYEALDSEVELSAEELEIQEDSGARRVTLTNQASKAEPQPARRITARNLGAIDDLFDRAERKADALSDSGADPKADLRGDASDDRRTDPSHSVASLTGRAPDRSALDPDDDRDPPRPRRGTLPRRVS